MSDLAFHLLHYKSEAERLDKEINTTFRKVSSGTATSSEISEGTRLLRERANGMMPGVFANWRSADKKR